MNWFLFALICLLGWGGADLFYKMGTDENDKDSHLKISVWVGLIMGVCAMALLPFCETVTAPTLLEGAVKYSPASIAYIVSMVIGYAGLRYLELSIVSPVQNASGALSAIIMLVYFMVIGKIESFWEEFSVLDVVGTVIIVVGFISLAVIEQRFASKEKAAEVKKEERKYRFGALALLFPLGYCLFDTLGTAADGIILDGETGLGLGEIDIIVLYGLTFLLAGLVAWLIMLIKNKKPYNPFAQTEIPKAIAAVCEEFGQIFYVYAFAAAEERVVVVAPMIASYCIVSMILSRIFLKEKLKASQYACVAAVVVGIVCLGISEGLAEL